MYGGMQVNFDIFLTLAVDGHQWSFSSSAALPLGKEHPVPKG
jgi:hypothetical protein